MDLRVEAHVQLEQRPKMVYVYLLPVQAQQRQLRMYRFSRVYIFDVRVYIYEYKWGFIWFNCCHVTYRDRTKQRNIVTRKKLYLYIIIMWIVRT